MSRLHLSDPCWLGREVFRELLGEASSTEAAVGETSARGASVTQWLWPPLGRIPGLLLIVPRAATDAYLCSSEPSRTAGSGDVCSLGVSGPRSSHGLAGRREDERKLDASHGGENVRHFQPRGGVHG